MNIAEKNLYNLLRNELKLSDESAASLVEALREFIKYKIEDAAKEDLCKLEL